MPGVATREISYFQGNSSLHSAGTELASLLSMKRRVLHFVGWDADGSDRSASATLRYDENDQAPKEFAHDLGDISRTPHSAGQVPRAIVARWRRTKSNKMVGAPCVTVRREPSRCRILVPDQNGAPRQVCADAATWTECNFKDDVAMRHS
jgi:hypothetical protein